MAAEGEEVEIREYERIKEWEKFTETVLSIKRALKNGCNKEKIGHHVVRNNTIFNCEQAGISWKPGDCIQ